MKKNTKNVGFCLFFDWVDELNYLAPEDAWSIVRAISAYYTEGRDPVESVASHLRTVAAMMFHQIRRLEELRARKATAGQKGGKKRVENEQTRARLIARNAGTLDADALDASALDASALDASALNADALDADAPDASALDADVLDADVPDADVLDADAPASDEST